MSPTYAAKSPPAADPLARVLQPVGLWLLSAPLWQLAALAVLLFAACDIGSNPGRLLASLGDTDDATRLTEVREFLAGRSWFDMTLPRFGGATPLLSHWSRLLDLPIAALILPFSMVLSPANAELAARVLWPLLVLFPLVWLMARHVEVLDGRKSALIAMALTVSCIGGRAQFLTGRIDHHNAMILGAVGGCLLLCRCLAAPRLGAAAGILLAMGTAIGYEAILLTVGALTVATLYCVWFGRDIDGVTKAAIGFAATLAVCFALTTAPSAWGVVRCDALSANLVLLAVSGAVGLLILRRFGERLSPVARIGLLAAAGMTGVLVYVAAEPACLAGPFGQVDPAVSTIWLNEVLETHSLIWLAGYSAQSVLLLAVYLLLGLWAARALAQRERCDPARVYTLIILIALPLAVWQLKLVPYASFLVIPALAIAANRLATRIARSENRTEDLAKLLAGVLALFGAISAVEAVTAKQGEQFSGQIKAMQACFGSAGYKPLADLPKGLAVTEIDLGPFLVALTKLDALGAPYHRIDKAIMETHAILMSPPAEAERRLQAVGATYLVTCPGFVSTKADRPVAADALRALLEAKTPPPFLNPVSLPGQTPLKVWRMALNPRP